MTQNIIVDTSALIAFFVKSETHHQRAKKSETRFLFIRRNPVDWGVEKPDLLYVGAIAAIGSPHKSGFFLTFLLQISKLLIKPNRRINIIPLIHLF